MSFVTGLKCLRCGKEYPTGKMFRGCPECAGVKRSNLTLTYDYAAIRKAFSRDLLSKRPPTMWRYQEFLPAKQENIVTLGEGMTPLVHCKSLGAQLGLSELYVKNEAMNPTWSYKDRLASSAVSMATEFGARVVTVASSGNHGAATAAYAARAGLDSVIFTVQEFPMTMRTLMQAHGAKVIAAPRPRDRWKLIEATVDAYDWYPMGNFVDPPIGSNPYGVDGYKTIAFEICEQRGWKAPDKVVMPVGHGDGFYGTWKGFEEFYQLGLIGKRPQMIAAEVFGSLKAALAQGLDYVPAVPSGPTVSFSVGVDQSTYQTLKTLLDSGGTAEVASDGEVMDMQLSLGACEGIYGEAASVLTLAVVQKLVQTGRIGADESVVAVVTSSGLKDPGSTQQYLPKIPVVQPNLEALKAGLAAAYGYHVP